MALPSYYFKLHFKNLIFYRRSLLPLSSSSSDYTSTTKADSSNTSKHLSVTSKCYDTDAESSATICNHVHYKKNTIINEPKSIKKCCENTVRGIEEGQKQSINKYKTAYSQTKPVKEINEKSYRKYSTQSGETYTVDHQVKPISCKSSISYDIIFKPTSKCLKEINLVRLID